MTAALFSYDLLEPTVLVIGGGGLLAILALLGYAVAKVGPRADPRAPIRPVGLWPVPVEAKERVSR